MGHAGQSASPDEWVCFGGYRSGNKDLANRFISKYAPLVYRFAYRLSGNRTDAEDVQQEVLLRLLRTPNPPSEGNLHGYICKVADHCMREEWRWRKKHPRVSAEQTTPEGQTRGQRNSDNAEEATSDPTQGGELAKALAAGLQTLSAKEQEVVILYWVKDMRQVGIAKAQHVSRAAVNQCLDSAFSKLRQFLAAFGYR